MAGVSASVYAPKTETIMIWGHDLGFHRRKCLSLWGSILGHDGRNPRGPWTVLVLR